MKLWDCGGTFIISVIGLVVGTLIFASTMVLREEVSIRVGQTVSTAVPTNLMNVTVTSSNPSIARVRFAQDRLFVTGMNPGKATVTFRAERVRYLAGFDVNAPKITPHTTKPPDLAEYFDVQKTFEFTVVPSGGGMAGAVGGGGERPPFPAISADDYLVVRVGKTLSATLPGGASGVRASSSANDVASVSAADGRVRITGKKEGRAVVTVSGRITRFLVGITKAGELGETYEFTQTFFVDVTDDPKKENPKPKRTAKAEAKTPIYQICSLARRSFSVPSDINPLVFEVGGGAPVTVRQEGSRIVITPVEGRTGSATIVAKENRARVNKPYFRQKFEIEVVPCNVSGDWIGGGGFQMTQEGNQVAATFRDGRTFLGTLNGRDLKLVFTYRELAQTPANLPADLRNQLIGTTVVFEGALKGPTAPEGDSNFEGKLTRDVFEREVDLDSEETKIVRVRKTDSFKFRRKEPHTAVVTR